MTVSSTDSKTQYTGDGTTTDFATGFEFLQNADVKVIETVIATGIETTFAEGTEYTLTGAGTAAGGTVTFSTAPAATKRITIKRDAANTQPTSLPLGGPLPSADVEEAVDRIVMLIQQLTEKLSRAVLLDEGSTFGDLPLDDPEANKLVGWNSSATRLVPTAIKDLDLNVDLLLQTQRTYDRLVWDGAKFINVPDSPRQRHELGNGGASAASHPNTTGLVLEVDFGNSNRRISTGASFRYTGTTTSAKAGNWPNADGFYYDVDGKQFQNQDRGGIWAIENGVVFDDSTDNAIALQALANLGRPIFMSAGVAQTTAEIDCGTDGCKFIGPGMQFNTAAAHLTGNSTIKYTGAAGANTCVLRFSKQAVGTQVGASDNLFSVGVEGMVVDCNDLAEFGIYAARVVGSRSVFRDIGIWQSEEHGFWGADLFTCTFDQITCTDNAKNGFTLGLDIFSWGGNTLINNCSIRNVSATSNGTEGTFNETSNITEGVGIYIQLHRGNSCYDLNAENNDGPGILVECTGSPNQFIGGYVENNTTSNSTARATDAWGIWFEGDATGGSNMVTFQNFTVLDAVKLAGTEPTVGADGFTCLRFERCFINGNFDAEWGNYKLLDCRVNGSFTDQIGDGRLISVDQRDLHASGVCLGWLVMTGVSGTPVITTQFNFASIDDNNPGDYTARFTTNMPDGNYCVIVSTGDNHSVGVVSKSTSGINIRNRDLAGNLTDVGSTICLAVYDNT